MAAKLLRAYSFSGFISVNPCSSVANRFFWFIN
jgi:hypothetical protein